MTDDNEDVPAEQEDVMTEVPTSRLKAEPILDCHMSFKDADGKMRHMHISEHGIKIDEGRLGTNDLIFVTTVSNHCKDFMGYLLQRQKRTRVNPEPKVAVN